MALVASDDPFKKLMERIVWILPPVSTISTRTTRCRAVLVLRLVT